ncbi:invasion protein IalB [Breoghania corrubedonensis]|uniref:Invasion protein IalB n=1 Tax=Breoghania corrubedonensis TaxID=665038 RepID=A0A2T5V8H4_9HYPH|nr:invasion associated locus B family protein [Breoghania corrubedonensis]PTW60069.1 invasion protein IalB [Breoghania corrubedonensis]
MSFRPSFRLMTAAALLAAGLSAPVALAQGTRQEQPAAAATTENARLWSVSCADTAAGGGSQCQMVQTLAMKNTGKRLLTIAVQKQEKAEHPRLIVGLPHGVYFPAGIGIAVDEAGKKKIEVETSDANGAYAIAEIDDGLLEALRKGTQLKVSFESGKRQELVVPVSLTGFSEAYQRVSSFGG